MQKQYVVLLTPNLEDLNLSNVNPKPIPNNKTQTKPNPYPNNKPQTNHNKNLLLGS